MAGNEVTARVGRGITHNLGDFTLAAGADQAMLVAIPLMGAGVAIDDLAVARRVEMAVGRGAAGSHASSVRLGVLAALVRSEGT